ncbi:PI-PLC X domain-containing protein [Panicum miliaceum]|uniref:PI-PLC X domain-containing protein n=1 Tax=Panicum miliaceum TaxID=4540 RepID=A0A3L6QRF8_PANMI|nr:PI-PLC X domain-containing protein [Panicum miliaceum]
MPNKPGAEWPLLKDMIAENHRLVVFTSKQGKQGSEGLAYEWDYVVENQYGSQGLVDGRCPSRGESKPMDSRAQSLVLMNFFTTNPSQSWACGNNSAPLVSRLRTCYDAAGKRWPNFIAVDFYMRSTGGGAPLATDVANGRLQCGCDSIAYCKSGTCAMPSSTPPPAPAPHWAPSPGPGPAAAPAPTPSIVFSSSSSPGPASSDPPNS